MDYLLKTKLLNLLSEPTMEETTNEMKSAYGDFMNQIKSFIQSETDFSNIFRTLSFTRIEFKALQTQTLCEQGKKCA